MPSKDIDEQLTKYLTDAHAIEEQALIQMRGAPLIAEDPEIAQAFKQHKAETEGHEGSIRARLEARGASPSRIKDVAGLVTGVGFTLFAKFQPDTPGKLVTHAFSYEHLELATYDLLAQVAERAGDAETVRAAQEIRAQEDAMADRLAGLFDRAVEVSLRDQDPDDMTKQLVHYLTDAHALEAQAVQLLSKGQKIAEVPALRETFDEHLTETHGHSQRLEQRLDELGAGPSKLKDAALSLGALNWGLFFGAQPDTPAKLAGFAYAYEHLEIAGYELLRRVAERASDPETAAVATTILAEERAAAEKLYGLFGVALDASLRDQGVAA